MEKIDELMGKLSDLTVVELIALTKQLEDKWGVKAQPQNIQTNNGPTDTQNTVEQSEFTVVLASVPADKKMPVIKVIRELTLLGLKESKELAESAPKTLKEGVSKAEADEWKTKLAEAGAVIEVK